MDHSSKSCSVHKLTYKTMAKTFSYRLFKLNFTKIEFIFMI